MLCTYIFTFTINLLVYLQRWYGKRVLFGVGVSGIVLLILSFLNINILPINPIKLIALATSDIIVSIVFANYFKHRIPFLDYTDDLKAFIKISILGTIAQSALLYTIFRFTSQINNLDTLLGIQLVFTSVLSPLLVVVPFILTFYTKPDPINFKNNVFSIILLSYFFHYSKYYWYNFYFEQFKFRCCR